MNIEIINLQTFLVAFAIAFISIPLILKLLYKLKLGQPISEDAPDRHITKAGTPTMGGLIIIIGFLAGYAYYFHTNPTSAFNYLPVVVYMLLNSIIGMVDDWLTVFPKKGIRGIRSTHKAIIQLILSISFVAYILHFYPNTGIWLGNFRLDGIWYGLLAVLVITGFTNFVNITDGLDGLVAGLTAILSGIFAFSFGEPFMASMCGACLAFLYLNANPAKAFMGDTSSLFIGSGLIGYSVIAGQEIPLLIAGMIFIIDGISTMIQWAVFKITRITKGEGKRIFLKAPVHHHFEMLGYPEQKIVVRAWVAGVIFAILAVAIEFWV